MQNFYSFSLFVRLIPIALSQKKQLLKTSGKAFLILTLFFVSLVSSSGQANVVFYVPIPDELMQEGFEVITDAARRSISNDIQGIISIVASEEGTLVYYDHWEDGYEADIDNPIQSTIKVKGDVIVLENIFYDFDKYYIRNDAEEELDHVVSLMLKYPNMIIELGFQRFTFL